MSRSKRKRIYRVLLIVLTVSGVALLAIPSVRMRIELSLATINLGISRKFFPFNSTITLELYASGLNQPVYALPDPQNSDRLFVVERMGTMRIVEDGMLLDSPFLDITDQVAFEDLEQGLLSMAFHPSYSENGLFYVYYTSPSNDSTLVRYHTSEDNPDVADTDSEVVLLTIEQPNVTHNGGLLVFGPDGYLYLGLGNGGIGEEIEDTAQDRSNLLGSLLRLDVSDPQIGVPYYGIPPDNPFIGDPDARPEIWAYGLRNPWRYAFDDESGGIYIADVGEALREEINYLSIASASGANYGWRDFEGSLSREGGDDDPEGKVFPVAEYKHDAQGGCAIIGGYVYHGQAIPQLQGKYLYADSCTGFVWTLEQDNDGQWDSEKILDEGLLISSFARDVEGELYLLGLGSGEIHKIVEDNTSND